MEVGLLRLRSSVPTEMAPKDHVSEPAEMAPKDHELELAQMHAAADTSLEGGGGEGVGLGGEVVTPSSSPLLPNPKLV